MLRLQLALQTARIASTMQKFFRAVYRLKNPGTVFMVYPNYESDKRSEYTYCLGEKVHGVEHIQQDFETLVIPA